MNLILIGYRGSGKTTVAQRLALRLGWEWVDSDVELELRAGKTISEIFEECGEAGFRDLESAELAELCRRQSVVVAVGGGAILRQQNRELLKRSGQVIWLKADPETLFRRIGTDRTTAHRRPNLTNSGGRTEIQQVLAQRTPIYRGCADVEVDTENKDSTQVAEEIVARLNLQPDRSDPE